jgi:hypothetical protein
MRIFSPIFVSFSNLVLSIHMHWLFWRESTYSNILCIPVVNLFACTCTEGLIITSPGHRGLTYAKQKEQPKKSVKKKRFFRTAKHVLFSFFFILTPCSSLMHNFLIFFLVQIEQFKLLWNCHLKLYKSSCNSKGNRVIFKNFLGISKLSYELVDWEFSVKMSRPLLWEALTFSPLIRFCWFLVQKMHQEESSIYSLDTINNGALLQKTTSKP